MIGTAGEVLGGRFELQRPLGHGAMAEVWLARDLSLNAEAALKLIHPNLASDPAVLARLRFELEATRRIRHPGILGLRDLHTDASGRSWLSMDYAPGGDLRARILREGRLPPAEVARIGRQALSALGAAHAAGVVHRDIKPHNILFSADGSVLLADFGLARLAAPDQPEAEDVVAGTPDYCAPEIAAGLYADGRADIYSLGASLFEAATGRTPFEAESPWQAMKLRDESPAPRAASIDPGIPPWLDAALARALERDPAERFQDAPSFAAALTGDGLASARMDRRSARGVTCPRCGAPLPASLPWCWDCDTGAASLSPPKKGEKPWSVMVVGPGKAGTKLLFEQRDACLRILDAEGVDAAKLRKRIPRFPFTLCAGLSRSAAQSLAAALGGEGLEALALGAGCPQSDRALAAETQRSKLAAIVPRIWLIMLASGASGWNGIAQALRAGPSLSLPYIVAVILFLLAAPAIGIAIGSRRPQTRLVAGGARGAAGLLASAAEALRDPEIRGLALSAARRLDALGHRLGQASSDGGYVESEDAAELSARLEESGAFLSRLLAEAQEDLNALSKTDTTPAERRSLQSDLDEKRAAILSCSAALDGAVVALSGAGIAQGARDLANLGERLRDLEDKAAGWREAGGNA